jgi:hypothetical protein
MKRKIDLRNPMPIAEGPGRARADIVFCIDSTGSMQPCIDGVKHNVSEFVTGLETAGDVDFRVRLLSYRDLHDPTCPGPPWLETDFDAPMATGPFLSSLSSVVADGGGQYRSGESSLDALFRAARWSRWRDDSQRCIVLLTDDDSHPTLHQSTHKLAKDGWMLTVQALQELEHAFIYMCVPRFPIYERLEEELRRAHGKGRFLIRYVPNTQDEDKYAGLRSIDWKNEMRLLGQSISLASIEMKRRKSN